MKNNNEIYNNEIKQKFINELQSQNKEYQVYISFFHSTQQCETLNKKDLAELDKTQYEHLFIQNNWLTSTTYRNNTILLKNYVLWYKENINQNIETGNVDFDYAELCSYANFELMYYRDITDLMQNIRDVFSDDNYDDGYILSITVLLGLLFYNLDFDEINLLTRKNFLIPNEICFDSGKSIMVNPIFYRACLKYFDYNEIKARTTKYLQASPYLIRRSYSSLSCAQNDQELPDSKFMYNNRRKNWKEQFEKMGGYTKGLKMNKTSLTRSGMFSLVYEKGLTNKEDINKIIKQYIKVDVHGNLYTTYLSWRKYFYNE